ncbi:uncharacterized protein TM35_000381140, partial [Trypanosoma theileri]
HASETICNEARRKAVEEETRRKAEEEEEARRKAEQEARRKAEEEEARRKAEEEEARRKAEEEARRKAEEEARRKAEEEEEARRKAEEEEEAERKAVEEMHSGALKQKTVSVNLLSDICESVLSDALVHASETICNEARRKAVEEETRRAVEEMHSGALKQKAVTANLLSDICESVFSDALVLASKTICNEARRKAVEEETRRKAEEEEEARRKAEQEARRKAEEEEEARRKAEQEARRKAEEEEARRKAEEEEEARRKAEEEARRKAEEEEEARRKAEEEARRKAEEEEEAERKAVEEMHSGALKQKAVTVNLLSDICESVLSDAFAQASEAICNEARRKAVEEETRRKAEEEEEEARRKAEEEEEARRKAEQEEEARRKAEEEEEARRKAEQEEEARRKAEEEEEARRKAEQEEEARRKAEEEEEARRKAEEEARRKAEEEEAEHKEEEKNNRYRFVEGEDKCKNKDEGFLGGVDGVIRSSYEDPFSILESFDGAAGCGDSCMAHTCKPPHVGVVDRSLCRDALNKQKQVFDACEVLVSEWIRASFDLVEGKNTLGGVNRVPNLDAVSSASSDVYNNVATSCVVSSGNESSVISTKDNSVLVTGNSRDVSLTESKPSFATNVSGSFALTTGQGNNTNVVETVKVNPPVDYSLSVSSDGLRISPEKLPVLCVAPGTNKNMSSISAIEEAVTGYVVEMAGAAVEALGDPSALSYANIEMILRQGIFDAASAATGNPSDLTEEWRAGLRALAERIASDYVYFAWKLKLRKLDECLWHTEAFYTPEEIAERAVEVVSPRYSFESLQCSDVQFLTNHYVELARKGGLNESIYTEARLRENLFERRVDAAASPVLPFSPTSPSNRNNRSGGGRSMLTVDRRRAGLTQLVLGHALDNILEDIVADTTKWIASLVTK